MRDRWVILIVSLLVAIATTAPLVIAHHHTPPDAVPSGVYFINAADWNVYYNYAEQARQGSFLIENQMATDDSIRQFLPTFLVVGWVAKLTTLSVPTAFQLVRLAMIPVVVWLLLKVFRRWGMQRPILAVLAFFVVSGFGRGGALPDMNPFTAALFSPHQLVAWAGFLWALLAADRQRWRQTAVALTLTILTIPFAGAIATALCLAQLLRRSRRAALWLALALLPVAAYVWWVSQFASSQQYAAHNATLTLPPLTFLAGLSVAVPLVLLAWFRRTPTPPVLWWLLAIGIVAGPTQLPYAQRLLFGLALPVAWFVGHALVWLHHQLQPRVGPVAAGVLAAMGLCLLAIPGPVLLSVKFVQQSPRYSLTRDEFAVITWAHSQTPARWLTTFRHGQFIAGRLGQPVFVGHNVQTPQAAAKQALVAALIDGAVNPIILADAIRQHQLTRTVLPAETVPPANSEVRFIERFRTDSLVVYDLTLGNALVYSQ